MFWTWDHSTEWALNRPGAQTMGAINPYFRNAEAFVEDYSKLLQWCGRHHVDAVVIWGLLRDVHGGTDSVKRLGEVAHKNNVKILAGVGLAAYGGVYYEGPSPYSMARHLEKYPDLYAVNDKGEKMKYNYHACPSRRENHEHLVESLSWMFKTLPVGGVQMETGDTGVCQCSRCKERRKYPAGAMSWEDMGLMYPIATDAIRAVSPQAVIVCETYTNPEPHPNPKVQGAFGEGRPPWADECIAKFPKDVFVQWVCDQYVQPQSKRSGLKWTQAGRVSNTERRNIMRAHFGTFWSGRRGELAIDWIADMFQKSMEANFDAISLFGEVSPVNSGAELNYLALENYGSASNPKADLELFLEQVGAPLLGSKEGARRYLKYARLVDDNPGEIPSALEKIYQECGKHTAPIAHRWAWLGNWLATFI